MSSSEYRGSWHPACHVRNRAGSRGAPTRTSRFPPGTPYPSRHTSANAARSPRHAQGVYAHCAHVSPVRHAKRAIPYAVAGGALLWVALTTPFEDVGHAFERVSWWRILAITVPYLLT